MHKCVAIRVQDIIDNNQTAIASCGDIPLTKDEQKRVSDDEKAYADRIAAEGYKSQRRAEYPAVTDQLDAIMKWVASGAAPGVTEELNQLSAACMAVKEKYPKPEKEN